VCSSVPVAPAAKQTLVDGQDSELRLAAVVENWTVQLEPLLVVCSTEPPLPPTKQAAALGKERASRAEDVF
jgi:hypothetical protein